MKKGSEGSKGSQGSEGVVSPMEPLRGRVQRVQKVQRVQRGKVSPLHGDEYEVSVTGFPSRPHRHSEPQAKNLGKRRH